MTLLNDRFHSLSALLWQSWRFARTQPYPALVTTLGVVALSLGDLMEVIPFFSPLVASTLFPLFHEAHGLLALGLVLFAAHRWLPALGSAAILVFLAAHVPFFFLEFEENFLEMFRILLIALVAFIGIHLIALVQHREQEVKAAAELNMKVLNERLQLLGEAIQREERLTRIYRMISMAGRAQSPLKMADEFLDTLLAETGAVYASLTLVKPDSALGERADVFRAIEPFMVRSRPGGLSDEILRTRQGQYIADVMTDPRANPALVQAGIRSYIGVPLKVGEKVSGILFVHSSRQDAFHDQQELLASVAEVLAFPLDRANLLDQVERAKREWEVTFDAIDDGVVVMDEERKIIRANEAFARLVGKRVQELPGRFVCSMVHGNDAPVPSCPLERVNGLGRPQAVELQEPHLGNKLLDIRIFPIPSAPDAPRRFVHLFRVLH